MTTSNLMSLPIDIPWERLGTSKDMMDPKGGDRKYPPKWRSSLAVSYYEPVAGEQKFADRIMTYIKVSCTITGLQAGGSYDEKGNLVEVHMPPKDLLPLWKWKPWENYNQAVRSYYPCYAAMLQVGVFPGGISGPKPPLEKYPFIVDFEPKKREMYESATEANQFMSHSRSGINIKKGTTTTEKQESNWNIAGAVKGTLGGLAGGAGKIAGEISGGYGEKSGTTTETVDMMTADYSREKRENYSYTTNLTHMYHLLNAYHLGTNRAMFLVQPRPHIMDSEYTFVKGPRKLEGIQEFFLIVERPKDIPRLCVEATLETAHLGMRTAYVARIIPISDLYKNESYKKTADARGLSDADKDGLAKWLENIVGGWWKKTADVPPLKPGQTSLKGKVCVARGWNHLALDERTKLIEAFKKGELLKNDVYRDPKYRPWHLDEITNKWVKEDPGHLQGLVNTVLGMNEDIGTQNAVVIYERVHKHTGTLFLTGRTTYNCTGQVTLSIAKGKQDFLVDERQIDIPSEMDDPSAKNIARAGAANRVIETIGQEMIESLSSSSRLPYREVGLSEASFVQEPIRKVLAEEMPEEDSCNVTLDKVENLDPKLGARLTEAFNVKTRKEALGIELFQLRTALDLTQSEARGLYSQLIGQGPQMQVRLGAIIVPNVEGMSLELARRLLERTRLTVKKKVAYQDALDSRGTVLNQFPNAGTTVHKGDPVSLVVSSGPVTVPDVVGLDVEEATARVEKLSLRVKQTFAVTDEQLEGHVAETTPSAETEVLRNSQVVLLIARKAQTARGKTRSRKRK